jgi:hypothetical protein
MRGSTVYIGEKLYSSFLLAHCINHLVLGVHWYWGYMGRSWPTWMPLPVQTLGAEQKRRLEMGMEQKDAQRLIRNLRVMLAHWVPIGRCNFHDCKFSCVFQLIY